MSYFVGFLLDIPPYTQDRLNHILRYQKDNLLYFNNNVTAHASIALPKRVASAFKDKWFIINSPKNTNWSNSLRNIPELWKLSLKQVDEIFDCLSQQFNYVIFPWGDRSYIPIVGLITLSESLASFYLEEYKSNSKPFANKVSEDDSFDNAVLDLYNRTNASLFVSHYNVEKYFSECYTAIIFSAFNLELPNRIWEASSFFSPPGLRLINFYSDDPDCFNPIDLWNNTEIRPIYKFTIYPVSGFSHKVWHGQVIDMAVFEALTKECFRMVVKEYSNSGIAPVMVTSLNSDYSNLDKIVEDMENSGLDLCFHNILVERFGWFIGIHRSNSMSYLICKDRQFLEVFQCIQVDDGFTVYSYI